MNSNALTKTPLAATQPWIEWTNLALGGNRAAAWIVGFGVTCLAGLQLSLRKRARTQGGFS